MFSKRKRGEKRIDFEEVFFQKKKQKLNKKESRSRIKRH
jgi:hypothetical protein